MARQKNSTALFDAIYSAKKPPKASPSAAIPTPKWWGKNKTLPKPSMPESTENVGRQRSWLSAAKKTTAAAPVPVVVPVSAESVVARSLVEDPAAAVDESPPAEPVTLETSEVFDSVAAEPKPRFMDRFVNRAPKPKPISEVEVADDVVDETDADTDTDSGPMAVESSIEPTSAAIEVKPDQLSDESSRRRRSSFVTVDTGAREFRFQLSYAGLVAIGFIFVMALAIAFIVGTRVSSLADDSSEQKAPTTASTSDLMAAVGPAMGPIVGPVMGPTTPAGDASISQQVKPDVLSIPQHPLRTAAPDPSTPPTPSLPIKSTRDIGMMYVVVQSYPEHDPAQKACDYMNHAGIPCTLVQGLADYAPRDWYSVIGLQPFNKHDPALPDYERSVKALGLKFTTRTIDQFQPQAYTWRDDSDISQ